MPEPGLVRPSSNSFGVQDAAQTYFGINASDLDWQAALLASVIDQHAQPVHQPPDGAGPAERSSTYDREPSGGGGVACRQAEPLGVLPQPNELPRGCIAAATAFFCDYVRSTCLGPGSAKEQVATGEVHLIPHHPGPRRCRHQSRPPSTSTPARTWPVFPA